MDRLGIKNVICLPQAQGGYHTYGGEWHVTDTLQTECNDFPCDTGSPREQLEALDEFNKFNLDRLTPDWTSKQGFYAADDATLNERARWVRQFLRDRPEHVIVLVAHGDILRRITADARGPSTYHWHNAEVREYNFDPDTVNSPTCFLRGVGEISLAGGYDQTSSEMELFK